MCVWWNSFCLFGSLTINLQVVHSGWASRGVGDERWSRLRAHSGHARDTGAWVHFNTQIADGVSGLIGEADECRHFRYSNTWIGRTASPHPSEEDQYRSVNVMADSGLTTRSEGTSNGVRLWGLHREWHGWGRDCIEDIAQSINFSIVSMYNIISRGEGLHV